jgi:hypothetical protein
MSSGHFLSQDVQPQGDLRGAAFYFDFAPVFERREKWRNDPERVALMCKNRVHAVAPGEWMIPQPGGFFLVMQTRAGAAAEALANDVNLALLELFFGTEALAAKLFRAVPYSEIVAAGLAAPAITAATPGAACAPGPTATTDAAHPASCDFVQPEKAAARRGARFEPGFLPMLNLQRESPTIFQCGVIDRRDGHTLFGAAALKDYDPKARPEVDVMMLEYSLGIARQIVPSKFAAAICTSVSYETLAWSKGRQLYQNALRNVGDAPLLIVKIEDVPPGTPGSRLAELVAMVRPFVKRVFVQLPCSDIGLMQNGHIGAAGLCMTLPANATPPAMVRLAAWLNRAANAQQAISCVEGVDNAKDLPLLRAAGVRFAAGRACDDNIHLDLPLGGECALPAQVA